MPATFPPPFPVTYNFTTLEATFLPSVERLAEVAKVDAKVVDILGDINLRKYYRFDYSPTGYLEAGYVVSGYVE